MKHGINAQALQRIAQGLSAIEKTFDTDTFIRYASEGLEEKELKERVLHIITCLKTTLPPFDIFAPKLKSLPKHWNYGNPNDPLKGFAAWPVIDYVASAGLHNLPLAFEVFEKITPLFSAEFAIRHFIDKDPQTSFVRLEAWTQSGDEHVRRLASEGCRPRLPWGIQLKDLVKDPEPILPILEQLKSDPSRYVQKSVANNLNDISKDHPAIVINTCKAWQNDDNKITDWIIKHACRTLIKAGNKECLALFGVTRAAIIKPKIQHVSIVKMGDEIEFIFYFTSLQQQSLIIDFAIGFQRANGSITQKVFKLKSLNASKGEVITLRKTYSFKPITTRKYYKGSQSVSLQVNGDEIIKSRFELA